MDLPLDVLCSDKEQKFTGNAVLNVLQKEAGRALPSRGIIAGQAVTSALLQLAGKPGVVYNDIDIFGQENKWAVVDPTIKLPERSIKRSFTGMSIKTEVFEDHQDTEDTGLDYTMFTTKTVNVLSIDKVSRDGDFNFISTPSFKFGQAPKDSIIQILNSFDINSVKVAVDLESGAFYAASSFKDWAKSRQLKIDFVHAGAQTLIRYLEKAKHAGNFANIELELAKCYCFVVEGLLLWFGACRSYQTQLKLGPEFREFKKKVDAWKKEIISGSASYDNNFFGELNAVEGWVKQLKQLRNMPTPSNLAFLESGRSGGFCVVGEKYYQRATKHPVVMEYFDFVKINSCYLVVPLKVPKLVLEHPQVFQKFLANSGRGFFNSHLSETCPTLLVDPTVAKSKKQALASLHNLHEIQVQWINQKAAIQLDRQKSVPAEWLIGAQDPVNEKYLKIFTQHRGELSVLAQANDLRELSWACKQLHNNIEKVFADSDFLFYAVLSRIQVAARQLENNVRTDIHVDQYQRAGHVKPAEASHYLQVCKGGLKSFCALEFVEFCLAVHLRMRAESEERAQTKLVTPLSQEYYPAEAFDRLNVVMQELITPRQLEDEGLRMHHCVGGYDSRVAQRECRIFSLVHSSGSRSTLELRYRTQQSENGEVYANFYKVQNRAPYNRDPIEELATAADMFISALNQLKLKEGTF